MDLPFGLIFSIFLIVVFIVIAFIAVRYFLNIGKCSEVGLFYRDLQDNVNDAWKSTETLNKTMEISLPSGVTKICFANMSARITSSEGREILNYNEDQNLFLIPTASACDMSSKFIAHLDIAKMTERRNPYCISVDNKIKIKKEIYSKFVVIE